jgi:glycosyltransferase involved in cell wall biosynthesis
VVSVIVPTRDRWRMLRRTLRGPLSQSGVELEVLVVDDSSDGETERGIAEDGDARVRHVPGRGRGVSDARNVGIAAARGAWIAFLDDDDLWAPGKLRRQIDAAEAAGAVFAYAAAVQVDEALRIVPGTLPPPPPPGEVERRLILSNAIPASCSNVVARAPDAKAIEGFDPRLAQVADWDVWLQLAERGAAVAIPDVLVAYMQHDESMLLRDTRDPFAEFDLLAAKHAELSRRLGQPFSRPRFARWVATRHRRTGNRLAAARLLVSPRGWRSGGYPGNLARAAGVAGGERLVGLGRRLRPGAAPQRPEWLDLYDPRNAQAAGG